MCAGAAGPRRSCSTARGSSTCAVKGRSSAAATATAAWPGRVAPRQPTLGLERPRTWAARSQQHPSLPEPALSTRWPFWPGPDSAFASSLPRPQLKLKPLFSGAISRAVGVLGRPPPNDAGSELSMVGPPPRQPRAASSRASGWARAASEGELIRYTSALLAASAALLPAPVRPHRPEAATSPHGRRLTRREASQEPGRQEARGLHRRRGQVLAAVQAGAARGRLLPARRTSCVGPARCADPLQLHVRGGAAELRDRVGDLHAHRGGPGAARVRWRPGVRDLLRR